MAYNEKLAEKVRQLLKNQKNGREKNDGWTHFYGE